MKFHAKKLFGTPFLYLCIPTNTKTPHTDHHLLLVQSWASLLAQNLAVCSVKPSDLITVHVVGYSVRSDDNMRKYTQKQDKLARLRGK